MMDVTTARIVMLVLKIPLVAILLQSLLIFSKNSSSRVVTAVIKAVNEREHVFMGCSYTITVSGPNYYRNVTRRFSIVYTMVLVSIHVYFYGLIFF